MKKQRLFDELNDDWTLLASVWGNKVKESLRPLVEEAVKNNISMRDLKTVIDAEVGDLIIYNILENLEKIKTKD